MKNFDPLLFLLFSACLITPVHSDYTMPNYLSILSDSYQHNFELPAPFGTVSVSMSTDDQTTAGSLVISFNDIAYEIEEEIWKDIYYPEQPTISIARAFSAMESSVNKFEVWFSFGNMQKVDMPCGNEVDSDCHIFERPALILTFDLEGLSKVERFYFGDEDRTIEYIRDQ